MSLRSRFSTFIQGLTASRVMVTDSSGNPASIANQAANTVLAGPATGAAANPAFRAMVTADLPSIDHGGLSGLADNDHPHYQLRCGISARTATFSYAAGVFTATYVSDYDAWTNGVKWTITNTRTVNIDTNYTLYYVYFDIDGVMKASTSELDLLGNTAPFALVFRVSASVAAMGDERHVPDRNRGLHAWAHESIGCRYDTLHGGLTGTFGATTFSISQGDVWDEDLLHSIVGAKTTCRRWSRSSIAAMTFVDGATVLYSLNGTNIQYDAAGTLTDCGANKYVCHYVFTTNDVTVPIYSLIGQAQHTNLVDAQNEATPVFTGLTTVEWKLLYKVIYRNTGSPPTYVGAQDYRSVSGVPTTFTPTAHASLSGLDVDDHTQYLLVAGTRAVTGDIDFNASYQCHDLQAPAANGEAIRATTKITEVLLESATDLKHTQGTDTQFITKALLTEQGDIIYASAASTPAALPHGNAGEVLTSGGNAANPSWAAAGGHAQQHALDSTVDHSVGSLVGALPLFTDATPTKLITKSIADARIALGFGADTKCRAHASAAQDNLSGWVQIVFGTEDYDIGGNFASNIFTAPVNGYYLISGSVGFVGGTAGGRLGAEILPSGGASGSFFWGTVGADGVGGVVFLDLRYLTAAQTVQILGIAVGNTTTDIEPTQVFIAVNLLSI